MAAVLTLSMSVSFSQDGGTASKAQKVLSTDPASAGLRLGEQRASVDNPIPPNAYQDAMKEWAALSTSRSSPTLAKGSKSKFSTLASSVAGMVWKPIGPSGIFVGGTTTWNGRIDAIAVNPNNPNVLHRRDRRRRVENDRRGRPLDPASGPSAGACDR